MSTPYEAKEWKNDINAFKAEYELEGGSVGTPYEIKPWMNEIEALRAEIEGGGGSSDFTTAEVTLVLTMPAGVTATEEGLANCIFPYPSLSQDALAFSVDYLDASEHKVVLPLYNGQAYFVLPFANANDGSYIQQDPSKVSLSGDAQYDSELHLFSVTGDCTVTATLEKDG